VSPRLCHGIVHVDKLVPCLNLRDQEH